jgi:inner membrane protein
VGTVSPKILADALTPAGVRPFAPYRDDFYSYDNSSAPNPIAKYVLVTFGLLEAVVAFAVGSAIATT